MALLIINKSGTDMWDVLYGQNKATTKPGYNQQRDPQKKTSKKGVFFWQTASDARVTRLGVQNHHIL